MPRAEIAIINTDIRLLELLRVLLNDVGYDVAIYRPDADTYHHLQRTQPALLVLDLGMHAAAAGWSLLNLLRLDPQIGQIPILITTLDHPFTAEQNAYIQAHGWDILEFPRDVAAVHARVGQLLRGADHPQGT